MALAQGLNGAPGIKVTFPSGITGDPWARDGAGWSVLARGADYDAAHKNDWLGTELIAENLIGWREAAYLQTLYIATDESGYEHDGGGSVVVDGSGYAVPDATAVVTKTMNILAYATRKPYNRDVRLVQYQDTTDFTEK